MLKNTRLAFTAATTALLAAGASFSLGLHPAVAAQLAKVCETAATDAVCETESRSTTPPVRPQEKADGSPIIISPTPDTGGNTAAGLGTNTSPTNPDSGGTAGEATGGNRQRKPDG